MAAVTCEQTWTFTVDEWQLWRVPKPGHSQRRMRVLVIILCWSLTVENGSCCEYTNSLLRRTGASSGMQGPYRVNYIEVSEIKRHIFPFIDKVNIKQCIRTDRKQANEREREREREWMKERVWVCAGVIDVITLTYRYSDTYILHAPNRLIL